MKNFPSRLIVACLSFVFVSSCMQGDPTYLSQQKRVVSGPSVTDNSTPLDLALKCYGKLLEREFSRSHGKGSKSSSLSIAVGAIQDYTGKSSDVDGSVVTQGASPMMFSALHKLGDSIQVHERFDTRVTELELAYMEKRRLGDGGVHEVDGQEVPWKPYFGGTILQSDYYIVGGITELNYNIQSSGGEFRVNQVGPKSRSYTMNIAADLRLVNSSSLVVEAATSVQKQIVGYEIGFELFSFFGDGLFDVNIGAKDNEPLQLGVRATLEFGLLRLLEDITDVSYDVCLPEAWENPYGGDRASAVKTGASSMQRAKSLPVGLVTRTLLH